MRPWLGDEPGALCLVGPRSRSPSTSPRASQRSLSPTHVAGPGAQPLAGGERGRSPPATRGPDGTPCPAWAARPRSGPSRKSSGAFCSTSGTPNYSMLEAARTRLGGRGYQRCGRRIARRCSGRRRGGVGVATWRARRTAKGRTTEAESATGQLVARGIPLPVNGALPRRAPPGLRPGPATCMATGNAASVAWCASCWRAGALRPWRGARHAGAGSRCCSARGPGGSNRVGRIGQGGRIGRLACSAAHSEQTATDQPTECVARRARLRLDARFDLAGLSGASDWTRLAVAGYPTRSHEAARNEASSAWASVRCMVLDMLATSWESPTSTVDQRASTPPTNQQGGSRMVPRPLSRDAAL